MGQTSQGMVNRFSLTTGRSIRTVLVGFMGHLRFAKVTRQPLSHEPSGRFTPQAGQDDAQDDSVGSKTSLPRTRLLDRLTTQGMPAGGPGIGPHPRVDRDGSIPIFHDPVRPSVTACSIARCIVSPRLDGETGVSVSPTKSPTPTVGGLRPGACSRSVIPATERWPGPSPSRASGSEGHRHQQFPDLLQGLSVVSQRKAIDALLHAVALRALHQGSAASSLVHPGEELTASLYVGRSLPQCTCNHDLHHGRFASSETRRTGDRPSDFHSVKFKLSRTMSRDRCGEEDYLPQRVSRHHGPGGAAPTSHSGPCAPLLSAIPA